MSHHNEMEIRFLSLPENEAFARVVIAAFAVQLSPTVSEIADIKTAVSEAVTNAIVHGYEGTRGTVILRASIDGTLLTIEITDKGRGIARRWNRFLPRTRNRNAAAWGLPSCRRSWTTCALHPRPVRARPCG